MAANKEAAIMGSITPATWLSEKETKVWLQYFC